MINLGQGAAILAAGAIADRVLPSTVVGYAGVIGIFVALGFGAVRPASSRVQPSGLARHSAERVK